MSANEEPPDPSSPERTLAAKLGLHLSTARQPTPDESAAHLLERERKLADAEACERRDSALAGCGAVVNHFRRQLSPLWVEASAGRNREYRAFVDEGAGLDKPPVMVGTVDNGEAEQLAACRSSVERQSYPDYEHVILGDLPEEQAHAALMDQFRSSDFDVLVELDADVVLHDETFLERVIQVFTAGDDVALLQAAILDYFSGGAMQGITVHRRVRTEHSQRLVTWRPFLRAATHSPSPSPFQALEFGVHAGLKVLQPDAQEYDHIQGAAQTLYLERTWQHFLKRRDPLLALACLGFELALADEYAPGYSDWTQAGIKASVSQYERLGADELEELVEGRRVQESRAREEARDLRARRREIYWSASAPISSIVVLLPHFEVYGGVNRFFELALCFGELGVECVLAKPDPSLGPKRVKRRESRPDYPSVRTMLYSEALARSWDVALCGDYSSGVMLTLPFFESRVSAVYLLNGWEQREANVQQIRAVSPDIVIANSSYAARYYRDCAPCIVPGGINTDVFQPARPARGEERVEGAVFRVGAYGGRRKPIKRLEDVLASCQTLHDSGVPVELHVFDQDESELRAPFECRLHGGLEAHQVRDLMGTLDAFVSAEEGAGWSNPSAEAMACGTPLVCTEAGTTDFAIDGETALVVEVGDRDAIAMALARLWEDPIAASRMAAEGATRIRQFSWPSVARQLLESFTEIRHERTRRSVLNAELRSELTALATGDDSWRGRLARLLQVR